MNFVGWTRYKALKFFLYLRSRTRVIRDYLLFMTAASQVDFHHSSVADFQPVPDKNEQTLYHHQE